MALEARPGCSIFPPHLLKVLAGRQRHAMAHQNGLVALRMMHILFLGDKLDRVAEDVKSMFSSISSCPKLAPRSAHLLYGGERSFKPHNRFLPLPPHFTLGSPS